MLAHCLILMKFIFHFEWKKIAQNWLKTHFRPMSFCFFYPLLVGWWLGFIFSYLYRYGGQCTIQFDDYVVITDGLGSGVFSSATVAAYNDYGDRTDLPSLEKGRGHHGCGHYIDDDGNLVNCQALS